ncbi:Carboxymuconolactone decarboxylase family protein [Corynebacterium capitovis DSM 44611]|uniref:alkylhydroperoxidase domain protein n=1 Tax=Corynebacterium capitovis TaxID=131081 RepID=UPI0003677423|nr:alkylhydroperoxidase domain protein [Corynebacterium capitovis]WKD56941.1 Carboxymuconolactone decarboxylase family protein [Corynebacterium capitovis DSM 44611]
MSNIIDLLSDIPDDVARLRRARPDAVANAELSFQALFEPAEEKDLPQAWRYAVATFIAGVSGSSSAARFYRDLLSDEAGEDLITLVNEAIARGTSTGPYTGGEYVVFDGPHAGLSAALDFAHLLTFHPKDASPAAIGHLQRAGFSDDAIVSLAQLISFVAFQLRVAHGLHVLAGGSAAAPATRARGVANPGWAPGPRTILPDVVSPTHFVNHSLGWKPWVADLPKEQFTPAHYDALVEPSRIDSEYFRLLARDPAALKARTLTDFDIFFNTEGGLGRAERELVATVVSRLNGCEYCASVHQARSKQEGGDAEAIDGLLRDGVGADLGTDAWNALRDAAVSLTATPFEFGPGDVEKLRAAGCDELAIIDVVNSASFFNWANRLMLTLGQPDVPKRFR